MNNLTTVVYNAYNKVNNFAKIPLYKAARLSGREHRFSCPSYLSNLLQLIFRIRASAQYTPSVRDYTKHAVIRSFNTDQDDPYVRGQQGKGSDSEK